MRKIFTSLALVLCVEVLIYLFFAFCNWDLCWIPEVSALRDLYMLLLRFSELYRLLVLYILKWRNDI